MTIQVDSRERKFDHIKEQFDKASVKWFISKLPVADYMSLDHPRLMIDRKQSLHEVAKNICQDHERFIKELKRAQDLEIRLLFLVEHSRNIRTLSDVRHWKNPRKTVSPYALDGPELYKRLVTIENKYHVLFLFCEKRNTGAEIIRILSQNIPEYRIERR